MGLIVPEEVKLVLCREALFNKVKICASAVWGAITIKDSSMTGQKLNSLSCFLQTQHCHSHIHTQSCPWRTAVLLHSNGEKQSIAMVNGIALCNEYAVSSTEDQLPRPPHVHPQGIDISIWLFICCCSTLPFLYASSSVALKLLLNWHGNYKLM